MLKAVSSKIYKHSYGEISDHLPHFHTLRCDSHLKKACRNVLRYIGASNIFLNSSKNFCIKNSKSDPSSTKHSLSTDTNITSINCLGALPITIESSDVTSMGYNRDFPACHISYKPILIDERIKRKIPTQSQLPKAVKIRLVYRKWS